MKITNCIPKALLLSFGLSFLAMDLGAQEPVAARLLLSNRKQRIGYIADTNARGIKFQTTANRGEVGEGFAHSQVIGVVFDHENDIMGSARTEYIRGRYEQAEPLFQEIAEKYRNVAFISRKQLGNFACDARFYQIDCLRRLGRYSEIALALDSVTGQNLEKAVAEVHLPTIKLFRIWSEFASGKWDALEKSLADYQTPRRGQEAKFLEAAKFQELAPSTIVQLAFMRGKMYQARGDTENALSDFYRVVTFAYAADTVLTRKAMEEALALQAADPEVKTNFAQQTEIHALAKIYKEGFNKGEISVKYREFARKPKPPEGAKPPEAAKPPESAKEEPPAKAEQPPAKGK